MGGKKRKRSDTNANKGIRRPVLSKDNILDPQTEKFTRGFVCVQTRRPEKTFIGENNKEGDIRRHDINIEIDNKTIESETGNTVSSSPVKIGEDNGFRDDCLEKKKSRKLENSGGTNTIKKSKRKSSASFERFNSISKDPGHPKKIIKFEYEGHIPSTNKIWKKGKSNNVYLDPEYSKFVERFKDFLFEPNFFYDDQDRLSVKIEVSFNKQNRDIDNVVKPLLDTLQKCQIYKNDVNIDKINIKRKNYKINFLKICIKKK